MANMMAQAYTPQPGMAPVMHPGMAHGHPMGVHPQMGQPAPGGMPGVHPGMAVPQVTQGGPIVSGMPPNPGTPAPGGPMQNPMAMAHLGGGQGPIFHGQNPQMNMGQMQMNQANMSALAQQRRVQLAIMQQQQQNGQFQHGMMNMQGMGHMNPMQAQQMQQMRMQMVNNPNMAAHVNTTPQQQQMLIQQQNFLQHHSKMIQQQQHQQQATQHAIARAQQNQQIQHQAQQAQQAQQAAQQMQLSRSQEQTTQPPQPQSTPVSQPQPPSMPTPSNPPQPPTPVQKPPQATPNLAQAQPPNAPTPQVKQGEPEDDIKIQPDLPKQQIMEGLMAQPDLTQSISGQCILQLLSFQDVLAYPERPNDIEYWQEIVHKYFSTHASIRQQVFNRASNHDKSFQLNYPILARFYHSHFTNGVKQILMQSFEHSQEMLPNGGTHLYTTKATLTYVYSNNIRVITQGQIRVNFDMEQKIEHLYIAIKGWTEFVPRTLAVAPTSPEQSRPSPKMHKKGLQRQVSQIPRIPASPVGNCGVPDALIQFFEMAEIMTMMEPLMDYTYRNPGIGPRESLLRINASNAGLDNMAANNHMQNMAAMAVNGQAPFSNPRMAGMNPPNQFQSPAFAHLNLPQGQGSPHAGANHTPSPAHAQGGVQMVHQMSAQGSNISGGSQGASTNTSPNVSNKRRRASQIKEEDVNVPKGGDQTKPSPRVGKRLKGQGS